MHKRHTITPLPPILPGDSVCWYKASRRLEFFREVGEEAALIHFPSRIDGSVVVYSRFHAGFVNSVDDFCELTFLIARLFGVSTTNITEDGDRAYCIFTASGGGSNGL